MAKTIAIDTNLLVLLVVGATSKSYISDHKRCNVFDEDDFLILEMVVSSAANIVVTPNVLSEASNLLRQVKDPIRSEISKALQKFIENSTEFYVESSEASKKTEYIRLGLTDAGLLNLVPSSIVLLTDDFDLYYAASMSGREVINFNHLREGLK